MEKNLQSQPEASSSQTVKLVLYWLIVGVPSLWAVWQVVVKSAVLFK
ncbi:MAG: hypothetical protein SFU91_13975 [Chloroherpetonaceae bacterium]|nr:hypothetical protein [Chloroherpetonaceae bacterium]